MSRVMVDMMMMVIMLGGSYYLAVKLGLFEDFTGLGISPYSGPGSGGGGGGTSPIGAEVWNSSSTISSLEGKTLKEESDYGNDKVLHISNSGSGAKNFRVRNKMIEWGGDGTRIYFDFHKVSRPATDSEIEFHAIAANGIDNINVKFGNHRMNDYAFGGYGVGFGTNRVEIQTEYWHNDHTSEKHYSLSKPLPIGKMFGGKVRVQNSGDGKLMNAWISYNNDGNWTHVVKDHKVTKADWKPPSTVPAEHKNKKDVNEIKAGVYKGICHQWWVRNNGSGSRIGITNVKIRIGGGGETKQSAVAVVKPGYITPFVGTIPTHYHDDDHIGFQQWEDDEDGRIVPKG